MDETEILLDKTGDSAKHDPEVPDGNKTEPKKYKLCGYLNKYKDRSFVRGLKPHGTVVKKRWFVYSDSTCKLYYYKSEKDPDPLGEIDIALSSFSYHVDSTNNALFTISSNDKEYILEAESPQKRLYWLQQLQTARREFNEYLSMANSRSSRTNIGRPDSGLIQESNPLPLPAPDPLHDLTAIINSNMKNHSQELPDKTNKTNLNLPLKRFRSSSSPVKQESSTSNMPSDSDPATPITPQSPQNTSTEATNFDRLTRKLRNSFRIRKPKGSKLTSEFIEDDCKKCCQLREDLDTAVEEATRLKDRCDAFKDAVHLLQKDLESLQKEKSTLEKLINSSVTDADLLEILREKDRKIVDLEHNQHKLKNSLSALTSNLRESRIHSEHLEEKVSILTSLIENKDAAIVDLSRKIEMLETSSSIKEKGSAPTSTFYSSCSLSSYPHSGTISIGTQTLNPGYDDLSDTLDVYKCQNTFLNKEILELNLILKNRNEREKKLISESSNWEAKFYQIQSKYLLLLNDLHSPQSNQHDSAVLSQLLHDVVEAQGMTDLRVTERQGRGYNEFGFCVSAPDEADIQSKAEFLQKQSKIYAWVAENQKRSSCLSVNWENQWESFLAGTNAKELPNHPELKYLIREGIPYQYKGKVWRLLIESCIGKLKASCSPSYYQELLAMRTSTSTLDPSAKQIELDLLRTLPDNRHYETIYSDGIPKLRRVLLAYSRHNLAVGYCQGLNRLGAIALLFLNEEDAFWCLVYIIDYLMPPDFYTRNLLDSQVDQRVMKDLVSEKLPKLYAHFEQHDIDISLFTFNWFLCVFVDSVPPSTYLYIWDSFLYEGSKVLFRFALAIFKLCEEDILSKKDYISIFDYLRSVPEQVADLQRMKQVAFRWANPLSMKYIRNRREYYKAIVKAELDEVEEVRKTYYQAKKEPEQEDSEREDDLCEVKESEKDDKEEAIGLESSEKQATSKYSEMKDEVKEKIKEIKSTGLKLLSRPKELKPTLADVSTSQQMGDIYVEEATPAIDDDTFEVITLKTESPSDSEVADDPVSS